MVRLHLDMNMCYNVCTSEVNKYERNYNRDGEICKGI